MNTLSKLHKILVTLEHHRIFWIGIWNLKAIIWKQKTISNLIVVFVILHSPKILLENIHNQTKISTKKDEKHCLTSAKNTLTLKKHTNVGNY